MVDKRLNSDILNNEAPENTRINLKSALAHRGLSSSVENLQPVEVNPAIQNRVNEVYLAIRNTEQFYADYLETKKGEEIPRGNTVSVEYRELIMPDGEVVPDQTLSVDEMAKHWEDVAKGLADSCEDYDLTT